MKFSELYKYACGLDGPIVRVGELAKYVQSHHDEVGDVHFWPVTLDVEVIQGYVVFDFDRSTAYGEEFKILGIRYSDQLNRCWRRFVICKELMHAFDGEQERTNTRQRFAQLLQELETSPRPEDFSEMLKSEYTAEWMALLVLCPKRNRDELKARLESGEITQLDVALQIRVPEMVVSALMGEYYDIVLEDLVDSES